MSEFRKSGIYSGPSLRKGSILLEAILSVVILSVCITVIIQAMVSSLRSSNESADYFQALLFLENRSAELLQRNDLDNLKVTNETIQTVDGEYLLSFKEGILPEGYDMKEILLELNLKNGRKEKTMSMPVYLLKEEQKVPKDTGL